MQGRLLKLEMFRGLQTLRMAIHIRLCFWFEHISSSVYSTKQHSSSTNKHTTAPTQVTNTTIGLILDGTLTSNAPLSRPLRDCHPPSSQNVTVGGTPGKPTANGTIALISREPSAVNVAAAAALQCPAVQPSPQPAVCALCAMRPDPQRPGLLRVDEVCVADCPDVIDHCSPPNPSHILVE